jgi:hypothetical protein
MSFTFGIYPGGVAGSAAALVHPVTPDDPDRIRAALDTLQGPARRFVVRAYRPYAGTAGTDSPETPADPVRYARPGRPLDLVVQFREPAGRRDGWTDHLRATVRRDGPHLATLQVCEEPNVASPVLDGGIPNVLPALVEGVVAAAEEARRAGLDLRVGFNTAPTPDPADPFWPALGTLAGPDFHDALGYVGLDLFPDVFRPIPADRLAATVTALLRHHRETCLPRAGIGPDVPLHIAEHGWPTGPGRDERRQAEVLAEIIRAVHGLRDELNLRVYTLFALRDADSDSPDPYGRFGILRHDWRPRPAFDTYRNLVAELTED